MIQFFNIYVVQTLKFWLTYDFLLLESRTWIGYLFFFAIGGMAFYKYTEKNVTLLEALKKVFPKRVYLTKSFLNDILCYVIHMYAIWGFLTLMGWKSFTGSGANMSESFLVHYLGYSTAPFTSNLTANILYSLGNFMAFEIGWWTMHYANHKIPIFWAFHKVHHAPTQLNPLTNLRLHVVEWIPMYTWIGVLMGINLFIFKSMGFSPSEVNITSGLPAFLVLFLIFSNFRHSHIPISFGKFEYLLSSPATHQIHHSSKPEHLDKNFGYNLSILDWLFGTLVLPVKGETIKFGLHEDANYDPNVIRLYFLQPFQDVFKYIKNGEILGHAANSARHRAEAKKRDENRKAA